MENLKLKTTEFPKFNQLKKFLTENSPDFCNPSFWAFYIKNECNKTEISLSVDEHTHLMNWVRKNFKKCDWWNDKHISDAIIYVNKRQP
jgi:hypothetical protein